MAEINPFSLINNPRFTPSLPDHSAVQKLLTDSHIQGMKDRAAGTRNLLSTKAGLIQNLVTNKIPIPEALAIATQTPSLAGPDVTGILKRRDEDATAATRAGTFKDQMTGLKTGKEARINPTVQAGTPAQIAGGPFTVAPGLAVKPSVVTTITDKRKGYGHPDRPVGLTQWESGTKTQQKGGTSTVGPKTDAEQLFKAGRQDQLRHGMELSAKHLNISVKQLVDIVVKGLQDGSVTFFRDPAKNGSGVIINGQRHFWK